MALVYARFGTETISSLPYLFGEPAVYTCSIEVARQIVSTRGPFYKSPEITAITLYVLSSYQTRQAFDVFITTSVWGPNLFAANGDEWKRFRRITTPAFDHAT